MKSTPDILKKLVAGIKKVLWILGLHAFSIILIFILIDFILGSLVYYNYVFLADRQVQNSTQNIIKFDYKNYQKVMLDLQSREQAN